VQTVRLADPTTLTVELGPRFGGFKASTSPIETTTRMTIELASAQTDTPAAIPVPAPPAGGPVELPQSFGQPTSGIRTIAIDPGHGGDDDGAKSPNGVREKDLTLSVARRAKAAIEARLGVRVLLTREDDRNVAIDERAAIANNNKADLFISLHATASWRSAAAGAAVFSAAFDTDTAEAAAPDHVERVQAFGGGSRDIELVPWDLAQTRHLDRSAAFAELLEAQMRDHMPLAAHPNDKAPLRVLESANMPAILVELGYLTNPAQEKLLAGDAFQNAFVLALYEAVVRFRDAVAAGGGR